MQKQIIRETAADASNPYNALTLKTTVSEAEYALIAFLQGGHMPLLPFSDPDLLAAATDDGMTAAEIAEEQAQWRAAQKDLCEKLREYAERVSQI